MQSSINYSKKLIFRTLGNFLILSSVFLSVKTVYAPIKSEITYFLNNSILQKKYVVKVDSKPNLAQPKSQLGSFFGYKKTEELVPVSTDFSILIPAIGANAKVIANVNAAEETEYLQKLKEGVAHVAGTGLPGQGRHIYMFAHSTDYIWNVSIYNAVFYLLYKLKPSDEINIFFEGKRHVYEVTGSKIINPDEVQYITRQTQEEEITLQTCWPPGTTLQRLLVFAKPKKLDLK